MKRLVITFSWVNSDFYIPVTARCTKVNTAITRNRTMATSDQGLPAFDAMPSNPPALAKNSITYVITIQRV